MAVSAVNGQGLTSTAGDVVDGKNVLGSRKRDGLGEGITGGAIAIAIKIFTGRGRNQAISAGVDAEVVVTRVERLIRQQDQFLAGFLPMGGEGNGCAG